MRTADKEEIVNSVTENLKKIVTEELNKVLKDLNVHIILALQDQKVLEALSPVIADALHGALENQLQEQNDKIKNLERRVMKLEAETEEKERIDRNKDLIIHGIRENQGENLSDKALHMLNTDLELDLPSETIVSAQRLGRVREDNKPRPIRITFKSLTTKIEAYRNKRKLKGKNVTLTENLTPLRSDIYRRAKLAFGLANVWSVGGEVFVLDNGVKRRIRSLAEVESPLN